MPQLVSCLAGALSFFVLMFLHGRAAALPEPEAIERAATDTTWQRLLHLRDPGGKSPGASRVLADGRFFLHENGHADPAAELVATIAAMSAPATDVESDQHARCRFPARAMWLEETFGPEIFSGAPPDCPALARHQSANRVQSEGKVTIELIFVSGFLGNPASFFGHLLLQPVAQSGGALSDRKRLLEQSLNFGADIGPSDNAIKYIVFGLFGGYTASFTEATTHVIQHAYRESELRDLWSYPISLDASEHALLVAHLWELRQAKFRYTFLFDNCGYEMQRLLALVLPELETPQRPWIAPIDLVHQIGGAEATEPSIPRLLASRRRVMRQRLAALPSDRRESTFRVLRQIGQGDLKGLDAWLAHANARSANELDVALTYLGMSSGPRELASTPEARRRILARRMSLPPFMEGATHDAPLPPHERSRTARLFIGVLGRHPLASGSSLDPYFGVRLAYNDLLTAGLGRDQKGSLLALDGTWTLEGGTPVLQRLDAVTIENLDAEATGLPGDAKTAWRASLVAFDRGLLDAPVAYADGALGRSLPFGERATGFALAQMRVGGGASGPLAALGPEFGVLLDVAPGFAVATRLKGSWGLGVGSWLPEAWAGARIGASSRWEVRAEVGHRGQQGSRATLHTGISW